MNYTLLKQGDKLPAVGILQKLLNRTGGKLVVDGNFGPRTKTAVRNFQKLRRLGADGVVGKNTWPRLVASETNLKIIDCIDIFDEDLFNSEAKDIKKVGGTSVLIGGMCNGVEQAVTDIIAAAPFHGVSILRFHGHGSPGDIGISSGTGNLEDGIEHRSSIHSGNIANISSILQRLQKIFSHYGCVQFMHCSSGKGNRGRQLLNTMANKLRVPITAAIRIQYGGGLSTFKFEGPTYTALPSGGNLKSWTERLPEFPGMTVI